MNPDRLEGQADQHRSIPHSRDLTSPALALAPSGSDSTSRIACVNSGVWKDRASSTAAMSGPLAAEVRQLDEGERNAAYDDQRTEDLGEACEGA